MGAETVEKGEAPPSVQVINTAAAGDAKNQGSGASAVAGSLSVIPGGCTGAIIIAFI